MIIEKLKNGSHSGSSEPIVPRERSHKPLRITVVYTTIEGTLAALHAARLHSQGLDAKITVLVADEVAACYPLDRPPVPAHFFEKLCNAIIKELQVDEVVVSVGVYFCRRKIQCFEAVLPPRSLLVLGMKNGWWQRRNRNLAHTLTRLGHDVLVVPPGEKGVHFQSVVEQVLAKNFQSELARGTGRFDLSEG